MIAALSGAAAALGQGAIETDEGLELSLSAAGSVQSLKLNGVEYASPALMSGFAYRELPADPTDIAPNGSFESGSGSPDSWSWTNNGNGTWSWDSNVSAAGSKSLRVDVPGSMPKRSPVLTSNSFPIRPNTPYTFSCRTRTSGVSGSLKLYVVERDSAGRLVQRGVASASGTNDWETLSLTFTSSPIAAGASFKAEIYSGYGTAWLDAVEMLDVFGGRTPAPLAGTVAANSDGLTLTASMDGLDLAARFVDAGPAIRVEATLADSSAQDRAIELSFRLPLDLTGWTWEQNPVASLPIAEGVRYENLDRSFGAQSHSLYPLATVRNGAAAALTLATPMVPQMNRFSCDRQTGFSLTWDLGLSPAATKSPSSATVTFWIYTQDPRWGFRSAIERYYFLNANSFVSAADAASGSWVIGNKSRLSTVPGFRDFGWGRIEGVSEIDLANASGISSFHYVDPSGYFRNFPGYSAQPPYDVLAAALQTDATTGNDTLTDGIPRSEMARATLNSSPHDQAGRYQVFANSYFWYGNRLQIYPLSPFPEAPAPSAWSVLTKYSVDGRIAWAAGRGNHLDGIFLDDLTTTFGAVRNERREHWAYSDVPLTFSWRTGRVTVFDGFAMAAFCAAIRQFVHQRGLTLMGSLNPGSYAWFAPHLDFLGGEAQGAESDEQAYVRRVLGAGRPSSNLFVPAGGVPPKAAEVLGYLRQALLLGYFPGFNGTYWDNPASYERDRPLFRQYIPLIRTVAAAGWRPVNGATPSDPSIYVERFDDERGEVFYLTAQNVGDAPKTFRVSLDGPTLGIGSGSVQIQELLRDMAVPPSREGADVVFSDTLEAGETFVYRITAPRPQPPRRRQTHDVGPRH
ncbi:MAG: hypothetical protein ACM3SU_08670 [Acidobacteriota bacterium]